MYTSVQRKEHQRFSCEYLPINIDEGHENSINMSCLPSLPPSHSHINNTDWYTPCMVLRMDIEATGTTQPYRRPLNLFLVVDPPSVHGPLVPHPCPAGTRTRATTSRTMTRVVEVEPVVRRSCKRLLVTCRIGGCGRMDPSRSREKTSGLSLLAENTGPRTALESRDRRLVDSLCRHARSEFERC